MVEGLGSSYHEHNCRNLYAVVEIWREGVIAVTVPASTQLVPSQSYYLLEFRSRVDDR